MVLLGPAWCGMVRFDLVGHGVVRHDLVLSGQERSV